VPISDVSGVVTAEDIENEPKDKRKMFVVKNEESLII
jgi:hypothetical protein